MKSLFIVVWLAVYYIDDCPENSVKIGYVCVPTQHQQLRRKTFTDQIEAVNFTNAHAPLSLIVEIKSTGTITISNDVLYEYKACRTGECRP